MKGKLKTIIKSNKNIYRIALLLLDYKKKIKPITGNNIKILNRGIIKKKKIYIEGKDINITIENGTIINNLEIFIRGNSHTIFIDSNCSINNVNLWIEGEKGEIIIKEHTSIVSAHFCVQETNTKIELGKDCMLSNNIILRTSDSHPIYDLYTNNRINAAKSIIVGDHVWIAAKATIMKGCSIGNNAIIGYQSIVTKNIPENSLIAGSPAIILKKNINWTREKLF